VSTGTSTFIALAWTLDVSANFDEVVKSAKGEPQRLVSGEILEKEVEKIWRCSKHER